MEWTLFSPDEVSDLHELYGRAFERRYEEYERMAREGRIEKFKVISATKLWRKMLTRLFETGHPWITFKDPCNVRSPQDHAGVVHNSNLCTEITLNNSSEETAVCNLGSVNLAAHVEDGRIDRELLADTIRSAMRMLDNVVDLNFYPTEEARRSNLRHRPVGLGIMGFQDALYKLDIPFESDEAVELADRTMEIVSYHAILASSELARERGVYASYPGSKWERGIFPIDTLVLLEEERGRRIPIARDAALDWSPVREHVARFGMRNSNTMAIAPTATISNIAGCFPCIEPIYKNIYVKSNMSGEFTIVNEYLVRDLKGMGLWNEKMLEQLKYYDGNLALVPEIPERLKTKYREAFEIDPIHLVRMTAARGKWIDQSQSHNVFLKGTSGKKLDEDLLRGVGDRAQDDLLPAHPGRIPDREIDARCQDLRLHPEPRARPLDSGGGAQAAPAAGRRRNRHRCRGYERLLDHRSRLRGLPVSIVNNSKTDPNKILPLTYPWARKHYKAGVANNWTPDEIPMQDDIEQWKSGNHLSADGAPADPLESRFLLDRGIPYGQQHRPRGLPARHESRVPAIPAPPSLRRGGAYRHLHLLLRLPRPRPGGNLHDVQPDRIDS